VTLADIAIQKGFADQSHFTKAFRRVTGTTPAIGNAFFVAKADNPPADDAYFSNEESGTSCSFRSLQFLWLRL
jgi:AraC-like DNA-binding protein